MSSVGKQLDELSEIGTPPPEVLWHAASLPHIYRRSHVLPLQAESLPRVVLSLAGYKIPHPVSASASPASEIVRLMRG